MAENSEKNKNVVFSVSAKPSDVGSLKTEKESLIKSALNNVTIEPVMFLHMLGFTMTNIIVQNMYLDRICRVELEYSDETCEELLRNAGNKTIEEEVSGIASQYSLYRNLIELFFPIFFAIFLGPWTDKHGNKIPLLLPLCGSVLSAAIYTCFTFAPDLPPTYIMLSSIPVALSGGLVALVLSMLGFLSNVTTSENRSVRLGVLEACWFLGKPIGTLGGAKLYEAAGFAAVFIAAGASYAIGLYYGIIFLKNDKPKIKTDRSSNCCSDMFNTGAVKDMLSTVFARREPPRRLWILLSALLMSAKVMTIVGTSVCLFLFTRRQFNWNEQTFSTYTTVETLIEVLGTTLMTIVGLKMLKLGDTLVALISTITCIVANVIIAFAPEGPEMSWILYLAAVVQMFGDMTTIMSRSILSKIVTSQEIGKIFTFIACVEVAIVPLVGSTIYSGIYLMTQKHFAGTFSLVSAGANGLILVILIYLFISMRREAVSVEPTQESDNKERTINS